MASTDYTAEELKLRELKIEKNIPIRSRYPHEEFSSLAKKMEVGDSVWTDDTRVINGLTQALNKLGRTIVTRREKEGRRLWRKS